MLTKNQESKMNTGQLSSIITEEVYMIQIN